MTELENGSFVEIAGEHEDCYDPDFHIYNDVIVHDGKGDCRIYIYPKKVFPPTDFHSATLIGNKIIIIGNLGYMGERQPGHTPVYVLCTRSFRISPLVANGDKPGWISKHKATLLNQNEIMIDGGSVFDGESLVENDKRYVLSLKQKVWRRIAD